jgi:hypothetical protein
VIVFSNSVTSTINVTLTASVAGGCSDAVSKTFTIYALPGTCGFDAQRDYTGGPFNYKFEPTGGSATGISYTWLTGDGSLITSNGAGTEYNYDAPNKYCITMIATNSAGCECTTTKCVLPTTGIDNPSVLSGLVNMYPNPNTGVFTIDAGLLGVEKVKAEVFNTLGSLVYSNTADGSSMNIDLSAQASGVYTVKLYAGENVVTKLVTIAR